MKVKELIKALVELPQDADVYCNTMDGGIAEVTEACIAHPGDEEMKEAVGDEFVYIS